MRWMRSSNVPYIGARWERARACARTLATGGPWSFEGRHDREDMLRPNPPVDSGTIVSGLLGAGFARRGTSKTRAAWPRSGRSIRVRGSRSSTKRLDGTVEFPKFGAQSLLRGSRRLTASGKFATVMSLSNADRIGLVTLPATDTPRQRWAYVGGSGAFRRSALSRGGDQLVYLDGRYNFPISDGNPLSAHPWSRCAGPRRSRVGRWPSLAQATGVRVSAKRRLCRVPRRSGAAPWILRRRPLARPLSDALVCAALSVGG